MQVFEEAKLQKGLIPAAWLISGDPETRSTIIGKSADGMSYVMIWECGSVSMRWHYHRDEAIVVLDGEAFVTDQSGLERRYGSGDVLLCPRGTQLRWRVPEKFRKIALLKINVPRPLAFAARVWNRLARSASAS